MRLVIFVALVKKQAIIVISHQSFVRRGLGKRRAGKAAAGQVTCIKRLFRVYTMTATAVALRKTFIVSNVMMMLLLSRRTGFNYDHLNSLRFETFSAVTVAVDDGRRKVLLINSS